MTTFRAVDDDLILGEVMQLRAQCEHCLKKTVVVHIHTLNLPNGIESSTHLIPFYIENRDTLAADPIKQVKFLGIGCGCYAKFHRQIAYIKGARGMKEAKK